MGNSIKLLLVIFILFIQFGCGGGSKPSSPSVDNNNTSDNGSSDNSSSGDNNGTPPDNNTNYAFPSIQLNNGLDPLLLDAPDKFEYLSAGEGTVKVYNDEAFGQVLNNIVNNPNLEGIFKSGDHIFRSQHDGQGPLSNNTTCQGCHIKDGRGIVPDSPDTPMVSMFLRVSDGDGNDDPIYGNQIQIFGTTDNDSNALAKFNAALDEAKAYGEAYTWVEYEEVKGTFSDGETYTLRKPTYKIKDMAYGDFNSDVRFSARVSPHVFGSGLLESISEADIIAYADENDSDGDGISGRPAYTTHPITKDKMLARFGQKAVTATVLQQAADAYRGDMGVTNSLNPSEPCTELQEACLAQAEFENNYHHNGVDLNNLDLAQVEFYNRTLSVPQRRGYNEEANTWDDNVLKGRGLFYSANCHSCHVPRHKTAEAKGSLLGDVDLVQVNPDSRTNIFALEEQVIYPYTDLLLHDMGGSCEVTKESISGEQCDTGAGCHYVQRCSGLADGRPEGDASGTEWKTPPLWGLGLVQTVMPEATFLHDGRARTIQEAILWHDGEAKASQKAFVQMTKSDRDALLVFLSSL